MHPPFYKKSPEIIGAFLFGFMLTDHQKRLIKRVFLLLIPYTLLRVGFYFYHLSIYRKFTQEEIFESFVLGIRFDLAAILLLNIPIILLSLIPSTNKKFVSFERVLFIFLNSAGLISALNDYELFLFMGKRLSFDLFIISKDIIDQLPQLTLHYWYLPLTAIAFSVAFYFVDRKFFVVKKTQLSWIKQGVVGALLLGISFVGIRGGLQHKSINVQSAFVQGKNELGHLVLNTPYHFLRTLKNVPVKRVEYFVSDDVAKSIILNRRDFREKFKGSDRANVVLIILESFSMEYLEEGYAPFLEELAKRSYYFERHLANGRRSIEALPSFLCGLPSLLEEPLSKSIFQGNKFVCMPELLKKAGYSTQFFHGGAKGTMGFESYTLASGFQKYFSKEDYPNGGDYDGTWGIFDEPFFQFTAENIKKMPEPFLVGLFSLTSHQPYTIPKKYEGKFPKGTMEIHESIGYTDYSLKMFFESIENEPWFKKTLFVITSDHTQKLNSKKFQNMIGRYRVPMLLFAPGFDWKDKKIKVSQHSDIPNTILDFVGVASELPATSVSVLGGDQGMGINFSDGRTYFFAQDEKVLTLETGSQQQEFRYNWENGEMTPVAQTQDEILKAYLQYYFNGLISNNLSLYR